MGKSRQGNRDSIPGGRNGMEKALWCKVQSVIMVVVLAWGQGLQRQMSGSHPTWAGETGGAVYTLEDHAGGQCAGTRSGQRGRGKNEAGNHGVLQVGSGEDSELSQKQQGWREEWVWRG